jgi:hypothetical protein
MTINGILLNWNLTIRFDLGRKGEKEKDGDCNGQ